jgi:hypothetical protein
MLPCENPATGIHSDDRRIGGMCKRSELDHRTQCDGHNKIVFDCGFGCRTANVLQIIAAALDELLGDAHITRLDAVEQFLEGLGNRPTGRVEAISQERPFTLVQVRVCLPWA